MRGPFGGLRWTAAGRDQSRTSRVPRDPEPLERRPHCQAIHRCPAAASTAAARGRLPERAPAGTVRPSARPLPTQLRRYRRTARAGPLRSRARRGTGSSSGPPESAPLLIDAASRAPRFYKSSARGGAGLSSPATPCHVQSWQARLNVPLDQRSLRSSRSAWAGWRCAPSSQMEGTRPARARTRRPAGSHRLLQRTRSSMVSHILTQARRLRPHDGNSRGFAPGPSRLMGRSDGFTAGDGVRYCSYASDMSTLPCGEA